MEKINCRECQLMKLYNPKHPICNYHQGIQQEQKRILKIVDKFLFEHNAIILGGSWRELLQQIQSQETGLSAKKEVNSHKNLNQSPDSRKGKKNIVQEAINELRKEEKNNERIL